MRKKLILLFVFAVIIFSKSSYAKYVKEYETIIAKIDIDTISPKVEVISIESKENKKNSNSTHNVNIKVKIIENNIKENNFNKNQISIMEGGIKLNSELYEINQISQISNTIIYEIKLYGISTKEELQILIPEGTVKDFSNNKNQEKIINC